MALLALNIFAIPLFVQMIKVPYRILAPAVILICTIGTYSVNGSMIETWLMFVAGLVGFFMKVYGYSPAAQVLALVLGPLGAVAATDSHHFARVTRDLHRAAGVAVDPRRHRRQHPGRGAV